jgi:hypothetical protein
MHKGKKPNSFRNILISQLIYPIAPFDSPCVFISAAWIIFQSLYLIVQCS